MPPRPPILSSAQAQFPASANRTVIVANAWKPSAEQTHPESTGMRGWTRIGDYATFTVLRRLREQGYTWVNLEAGGCANPFRDVSISRLI